jgi:hypothetical protein
LDGSNVNVGIALTHRLAAATPDHIDGARFGSICRPPYRTRQASPSHGG